MTSTSAGGEQQDYIGKNSMDSYEVKKVTAPVNWETDVPGSKSITNRALLLAALCREQVRLQGVLFSDDSRHFLSSLQSLGYEVQIDEAACAVEVHGHGGSLPVTSGEIHVFGENIQKTDPVQLRRKIGYVIQQVGLFPHMTVEKNIAVVPEILG